jgi:hypothetical protein
MNMAIFNNSPRKTNCNIKIIGNTYIIKNAVLITIFKVTLCKKTFENR